MSFERLPEHRLQLLSDEELAAYVADAHAAGDPIAERLGLHLLTFGWEAQVRVWVSAKVPDQDINDVVVEVLESLTKACFKRKAIGRFRPFLRTLAHHRVVDYFREVKRYGVHAQAGTGQERDDENVIIPASLDETDTVGVREAVERVLTTRNPLHREVIRLYGAGMPGYEDLDAKQVAARIATDDRFDSVSPDNVAQIFSRFMTDVKAELYG